MQDKDIAVLCPLHGGRKLAEADGLGRGIEMAVVADREADCREDRPVIGPGRQPQPDLRRRVGEANEFAAKA